GNAQSEADTQPRPSCPDISPPPFHKAQAFIRNTRSWRSQPPARAWPEEQTPSSVFFSLSRIGSFAHSTSVDTEIQKHRETQGRKTSTRKRQHGGGASCSPHETKGLTHSPSSLLSYDTGKG
ncbi:unnamed protein product, partial [Ectocarpus sp. 6 AP-2014]